MSLCLLDVIMPSKKDRSYQMLANIRSWLNGKAVKQFGKDV